jgi:hypothetical protein
MPRESLFLQKAENWALSQLGSLNWPLTTGLSSDQRLNHRALIIFSTSPE